MAIVDAKKIQCLNIIQISSYELTSITKFNLDSIIVSCTEKQDDCYVVYIKQYQISSIHGLEFVGQKTKKLSEYYIKANEKNKKTNKGVITLKEASDTIKVSKDCPILVTYDSGEKDENGNTIYNELFRCESNNKQTLEKYGLSIQGKVITWDAKKYINNYMEENPDDTDKVVPSEVFIRYYIPRTNS